MYDKRVVWYLDAHRNSQPTRRNDYDLNRRQPSERRVSNRRVSAFGDRRQNHAKSEVAAKLYARIALLGVLEGDRRKNNGRRAHDGNPLI